VWEWCADGYAQVPGAGTATAGQRVIRGGSWKLAPRALRPALRDGCSPGKRRDTLGLRLACDA
jgi:formylglycine-generating enzyme required for sulfatase activity